MQNVSQLPSVSSTRLLNVVNNVQKDACLRENEERSLVMIVVNPVNVHL